MKKLITQLLIAAIATSALASCSGGNDTSVGNETTAATTAPVETEAEDTRIYPDHLPDVTYDNYDFKIAHWMIDGWTLLQDIDSEGQDGDLINDAVYKRNAKIEEKYSVNIIGTYVAHDQLNTVYRQMATAGDTSYDIVYVRSHEAPDLALNGFFLDLFQLENIDWNMPWWDQQSIEELSLGGKLFMAESDIILTDKGATGCMYFNTALQKDYGIEDMYQLVLDEKWTWNKMLDIAKGVRADLDGNSVMDDQDLWGVGLGDDITYMFLHAGNARYATKDENDYPVISFNTEYLHANGRGHKDVVSLFAKNEKKIQKKIDRLIKIVEDYE